jgi:hypothetical protein
MNKNGEMNGRYQWRDEQERRMNGGEMNGDCDVSNCDLRME